VSLSFPNSNSLSSFHGPFATIAAGNRNSGSSRRLEKCLGADSKKVAPLAELPSLGNADNGVGSSDGKTAEPPLNYRCIRKEKEGRLQQDQATITPKANTGAPPLKGEDLERMARRRYQRPNLIRRGDWWTIRIREDHFRNGKLYRIFRRIRVAPIKTNRTEAQKLADEILEPLNKGVVSIGSGTNFLNYVNTTYIPLIMPLLASTTQSRYLGVLRNYLLPAFGNLSFRDMTTMSLQRYFSKMATSPLAHESRDKIRDVLASVLTSAVTYGLLISNY
jgi:hypothetical protein